MGLGTKALQKNLLTCFKTPLGEVCGPGGAMREKNMNTVTENDNQSKSRKIFLANAKSVKATKKEIKQQ